MKSQIALGLIAAVWMGSSSIDSASAMGRVRSSNACEVDSAKYCLGVLEQGHEELVSCLKLHQTEISCECREAIGLSQP